MAREIYQEGIRIPPVLLMKGGKVQNDVMQIVLANVRTPEEREGDLLAQVMSNRRGEDRLLEIVSRYGLARVHRSAADLQNYSERVTRAMLREIPDGEYRFHDFLDDDGVTDAPVRIEVALRIKGDEVEVDFTGSSPQVAGSVNANYAIAVSAAMYCFRCLIDAEVPYNAGLLRPDSCHRAGAQRGERGSAGRHGRGQRRNLAAHHRRHSRSAGAGAARIEFRLPAPAP